MEPTAGTLVPAVVDGLIAAWSAALPEWQVVDGPFSPLLLGDYVVTVGVGNDTEADPFRVEVTETGMGGRRRESGTVRCQVAVTWGNATEGKPSRDAVAAALGLIDAGFRADSLLGGVCDRVLLGSQRWMHVQSDTTAYASCEFDVEYDGWL